MNADSILTYILTIVLVGAGWLLFAYIYTLIMRKVTYTQNFLYSLRWIITGAILGSTLSWFLSSLLGIYHDESGTPSALFGTIGAVVGAVVMVYFFKPRRR